MRLRSVAILLASLSTLALTSAVVADGMPAKKGKPAAVKAKPKKARVYNEGLHDESWEIANELNRQEWMRHRYGEGHRFGGDAGEDVVEYRDREHHGRHDRFARFELRRGGPGAPPPPTIDDLLERPQDGHHGRHMPPPMAELPEPPADLPPPPAVRERHHEFAGKARGGKKRAEVYAYRDSHSAAEHRSERYVNGRGGGHVQGHVDGRGYGYSWGDDVRDSHDRYAHRGGAKKRGGAHMGAGRYSSGSSSARYFDYSREEFETSSARSYGYSTGGGLYASGHGQRYIPPYGVVHQGRYTGRDADGYLTWPGKY